MALVRTGPVAIIAGNGSFPLEIATALSAQGDTCFIVGLRGFAERGIRRFDHVYADMLDPQRILETLRGIGARGVVLAGGVNRPGPTAALSIYSFFRHRTELKRILAGGDDHLLRGVISLFEEAGFPVLGVDDVAPGVLAGEGLLGSVEYAAQSATDISLGIEFLKVIGHYDIGQGVVVGDGRIIAVEGPEGTDSMLQRVTQMRKAKRLRLQHDQPVLVKVPKPTQDRRVDLPAIGPRTIESARRSGMSGIAVAAGDVVLVEREKLISRADEAGVFLVGVRARG
ncbi:MAG: LpxI family protein [Hyphomicrobiales bacterium]